MPRAPCARQGPPPTPRPVRTDFENKIAALPPGPPEPEYRARRSPWAGSAAPLQRIRTCVWTSFLPLASRDNLPERRMVSTIHKPGRENLSSPRMCGSSVERSRGPELESRRPKSSAQRLGGGPVLRFMRKKRGDPRRRGRPHEIPATVQKEIFNPNWMRRASVVEVILPKFADEKLVS